MNGNLHPSIEIHNNAPVKIKHLSALTHCQFWSFPVIKMKFKSVKRRSLRGRKVRSNSVYKTWKNGGDFRKLRKPRLQLETDHQCCSKWIQSHSKKQRFLVMGKNLGNSLVPTYIVPWSRDKVRSYVLFILCISRICSVHMPLNSALTMPDVFI